MKLAIIVAQDKNRAIGIENKLPWHLPEDLRYFKRVTMGKPIIMGRNTFDSIGRPLPGRVNIVVSRQEGYSPEGVKVVNSLEAATELAESICLIDGVDEAMIIGGAQIYSQAIGVADRLYLTEVDAEINGDAWFPEFDRSAWNEIGRENFLAEGPNPYNYSFIVLDKI
ncbi:MULTISPECIES: dihydrofolate reductase [unclassified Neptuniibacter]|uniref:dihydrofolate reductase n=1 Tax=unclassified Neptuniibacter TaxID=2630693 RepID=UPI000C448376|nr:MULTISPECIES: dihydrofolate reductase [unclassified Neptuniibacter]MAY41800.1 dihydrofolate reductase [Oceanospirillaceae bacterium]